MFFYYILQYILQTTKALVSDRRNTDLNNRLLFFITYGINQINCKCICKHIKFS